MQPTVSVGGTVTTAEPAGARHGSPDVGHSAAPWLRDHARGSSDAIPVIHVRTGHADGYEATRSGAGRP